MDSVTPVKRSSYLVKLSHEHHHGLVFCSRLMQATIYQSESIREYVIDFWNNSLSEHFVNEEKLFSPYLTDSSLCERFLREHKSIRTLIAAIQTGENIAKNAIELGETLREHIRFEEREMFTWLEANCAAADLILIGNQMDAVEVKRHEFQLKRTNDEH